MTILLLGATGYLGGNIARFLSKEGYTIICVIRRTSDKSMELTDNVFTITGLKMGKRFLRNQLKTG